jgi:methyl-accepting chemotaxis protein
MERSGKQTVTIHAQNLSSWVKSRLSQVEVIANTELVSSMKYKKIIPYFKREQKSYGGVFNSFGISKTDGKLTLQNGVVVDISTESTFPEVMNGKEVISNPFPDKQNASDLIISMECPVRNIKKNEIEGLVSGACLVSTVFKQNTNFHLGKTDKVYILGKDGAVIFDKNNYLKNKSTKANKERSKLIKQALSKKNFLGEFKSSDGTKKLFSSKIDGTDWYMFLEVPTNEYTSSLNSLLYLIIGLTIAAIGFLIAGAAILLRRFFRRLLKISLSAEEVAAGNLCSSLPESSDELGRINLTFNKMIDNLRNIIMEIKNASEVVVASSSSYRDVSHMVVEEGENTRQSIENVSLGAKNTAEEIQNIIMFINDMDDKSKELVNISANIDEMISETKDKTNDGAKNLDTAVEVMNRMKESVNLSADAITKLSEKSQIIANITTVISSISDRTNLLALNANIEAARAGEYGKGFSVVADEVKQLAEQSSASAKEISKEISQIQQEIQGAVTAMKDSINYMGLGTSSIDDILSTFGEIEQEIEKVKVMSSSISDIAKVLSEENEKVNEAVSNTSAISEESAASAMCLKDIVDKQESVFMNLMETSEHLDEISASLSSKVSRFKI